MAIGPAATQPYCQVDLIDLQQHYRVYDHRGSLMVATTSRAVAKQYLDLANQGISARVYYWLERWNYRVPRRYLEPL